MRRIRLAPTAAAVAIGVAVLLSTSSGLAAPGARSLPRGLARAIRARLGDGPIGFAARRAGNPDFGLRVSISNDGTTALVSAPGLANGKGAVYVYHAADAGSWTSSATPAATLTITATRHDLFFGQGVALSSDGTTAFIGAPGLIGTGAVYVFHVATEDAWTSTSAPAATLTVKHAVSIGYSIAASQDGTTVVVGAPFANTFKGAAYVFHASAEDAWTSASAPSATLTDAAEPASDGGVGGVVALSADGTTALLSDSGAGSSAGAAYVFHVASESGWATSSAPTATLSNGAGFANAGLGASLALSADGTTAFLGAPGVGGDKGALDVFHAADETSWATTATPTAILTDGSVGSGAELGAFVRASADGATVVATAPGVKKRTGAADVFHVADEASWTATGTPTATLTDSTRKHGDLLGVGLAVAGDGATVLLGAPGVNWYTGAADVFHVADAGSWVTSPTATATLTNAALPAPACVVPRIKGLPLFLAKVMLADATCRLGHVKHVHVTSKKLRGRVVSQSPKPGKQLAPGAKVSVKIGK